MAAIASKIRDFFSGILFDIEMFFVRSKGPKTAAVPTAPKGAGKLVPRTKEKPMEKLPVKLKMVRLSKKEKLFFYDQMATLVGSGVTLIDSLSIVQAQAKTKGVKRLYAEMIHRISGGLSLAETMYLFPKIFPSMQAALVEAAEKSGNLKNVLVSIVDEMEGQQDFVRKIKGAMFYPVILIVLALTMVAGMMIFVIPKVSELYDQSDASLPLLTQKVIDMSNFLQAKYPLIFGVLFGGTALLVFLVKKTRAGKLLWERFFDAIPVFGRIAKEKNIMMFASNMGMLLDSGVLISDAFEITEKTIDNLHYQKSLAEIRHGIMVGRGVSEMMGLEDIKAQKFKEHKLFPLQVAQLLHIGELTGTISKMMLKIRDNYKKSIDYTLKNISAMIEPIMIFFVALLVGSILLAVMLPFFYIGSTIG